MRQAKIIKHFPSLREYFSVLLDIGDTQVNILENVYHVCKPDYYINDYNRKKENPPIFCVLYTLSVDEYIFYILC